MHTRGLCVYVMCAVCRCICKYHVFFITHTYIQSYDNSGAVSSTITVYHIASVYKAIKDVKYMEYQYHNIEVKTISQYYAITATVVNGKASVSLKAEAFAH